jgi:predicted enzyme related to lactoylglutathione lyase
MGCAMITGAHAVVFSADAEADRAFIRDVLGFPHVDAGGGWLIFALPPAELAVHPAAEAPAAGSQQLYLMCDDLDATLRELKARGVRVGGEIAEQSWGRVTTIALPSGGELSMYEPRHARPQRG